MDPDLLRLILLLLGIVLVAAIYLGDKYKQRPLHRRSRWSPRQSVESAMPVMQEAEASVPGSGADVSRPAEAVVPDSKSPADVPVAAEATDDSNDSARLPSIKIDTHGPEKEPLVLTEADAMPTNNQLPPAELGFSAHGRTDHLSMNPALEGEVPRLMLQINVMRKKAPISGEEILALADELDLRPGKMDIFHRFDSSAEKMVLYSMANMVKPGNFPLKDMTEFQSPGLVLFTLLPGFRDGIAIYSDMLFTAERMVTMLDAELQDETHSVMTRQTIEHTREKILEHRRQVQLAQKRL